MLITESFIDSHTHLLSYASYLSKPHIDYGEINSKSDLIHQIESIVNDSNEYWIRIFGLNINENSLNINKNDLDQISTNVPIVITLDSLHGNLLNTKALDIIGITEYSNEPNGVTFDRQINNGKLSGYIFEGEYLIDEHIPKSSISDLTYKMEHISQIYEDNGYTLINDASINNDYKKFELLVNITSTNHFVPKIIFMPGFAHLSEFSRERLHYNNTIGSLRIGHCKIMLTSSSGKSVPNFETLSNQINDSHRAGFPVAIHAVDNLSVKVAIQAISANPFENDRTQSYDFRPKKGSVFIDNGKIIDITALSSGELTRVNTATLVAIRKLMSSISKSRINVLFLDEVINVLDEQGREKLVEVLLQEEGLNTYIVSHGWTHPLLEKIEVIKEDNISRLE